jgi:hypothetical protein
VLVGGETVGTPAVGELVAETRVGITEGTCEGSWVAVA